MCSGQSDTSFNDLFFGVLSRRIKKGSITTGIVDRSENIRRADASCAADRLSPLTSTIANSFIAFPPPGATDADHDLERFSEMDIDGPISDEPSDLELRRCPTNSSSTPASSVESDYGRTHPSEEPTIYNHNNYQTTATMVPTTAAGPTAATRRHTVGPGDVSYEQSLSVRPPQASFINFRFGCDPTATTDTKQQQQYHHQQHQQQANAHLLPIDLPSLQNQPLHNFSIKNHHLLKPPTVMENSEYKLLTLISSSNTQHNE